MSSPVQSRTLSRVGPRREISETSHPRRDWGNRPVSTGERGGGRVDGEAPSRGNDDRHWSLNNRPPAPRRLKTATAVLRPCSSIGHGMETISPATSWSAACFPASAVGRTAGSRRAPATSPTPTTSAAGLAHTGAGSSRELRAAPRRRLPRLSAAHRPRRGARRAAPGGTATVQDRSRRLAAPAGAVAGRAGHWPRAGGSLRSGSHNPAR